MVCHDCGCQEGELHEEGCDMEICTNCGGQKITCPCGDTNERETYFEKTYCCERCGKNTPVMKMVDDEKWRFICGYTYPLDCVLCRDCMLFISQKRIENQYSTIEGLDKLGREIIKAKNIKESADTKYYREERDVEEYLKFLQKYLGGIK